MAFDSLFGCRSTSSKDVWVVDRRVAFCARECGSVFFAASVYMNPPCHLKGVSAGSKWRMRVAVNVVISPGFSYAFEYCAVYGVWDSQGSATTFTNYFPKTRVDIW